MAQKLALYFGLSRLIIVFAPYYEAVAYVKITSVDASEHTKTFVDVKLRHLRVDP